VVIRRACRGDEPRLRDLRLRALVDAPEAFAATYDEDAERPDSEWERLTTDPEVAVFAAVDADGWAGMSAGRWFDHELAVVALWGMWVDPRSRRAGLGRRLVDAVHDWARDQGAAWLRVGVIDGLRLQDFYERLGFELTGETKPLPRDESQLAVFLARPVG
jgi:GNAT superfamily N-acetyltransferase